MPNSVDRERFVLLVLLILLTSQFVHAYDYEGSKQMEISFGGTNLDHGPVDLHVASPAMTGGA